MGRFICGLQRGDGHQLPTAMSEKGFVFFKLAIGVCRGAANRNLVKIIDKIIPRCFSIRQKFSCFAQFFEK